MANCGYIGGGVNALQESIRHLEPAEQQSDGLADSVHCLTIER